jgi:choline dehydrogenase
MDGEFDYLIVGAGSAGCVLAERLSADGRTRVLVLEAGGSDRRFFVQMPLGYGKLYFDPRVNWCYRTEPDPGLAGNVDYWPRGKVVGGSSAINAMVWVRGHPQDYEDWRGAGNPGWGWEEAHAAFREIEDNADGDEGGRGIGGPLYIGSSRTPGHALVEPFLAACENVGLKRNRDFNGADQEGVGIYQMTIRGGRRNSAARAFLHPALRRGNVALRTGAHVTRVLFDGCRAIGVEYRWKGRLLQARAGEVVLSGGAINSPQLLMLSGIGPGAQLRDHGIPVLHDQPNVGQHLSDHQGINYTWCAHVPTMNDLLRPWWGKLRVGLRYLARRDGPLSLSINHAGGFFRTDPTRARPNMQLYFQAFSTLLPRPGQRPILSPDPYSGLSIGLSNCRPTSRGRIALASPDPFAAPRIFGNAYSTDADVAEMLDAVKMLRRIAAAPPLAELLDEELRPGADVQTDEALVADLRARSGTVFHPSCTCRMGPDPASAVVDPRLRVHGVEGLRVCDASAFPSLIAGNTNAPAMLMGWIGSRMMLEDRRAHA